MTDRHDAGGRLRLKLLPGVVGDAGFRGLKDEHRVWLSRRPATSTGAVLGQAYALWVGMNPSTAAGDEDDLTVRKEQEWTRRLGLACYFKVNVGSYRSTDPAGLAAAGVQVSHICNLGIIMGLARKASMVILATGIPPKVLEPTARVVLAALVGEGLELHCLGVTAAGWPRHSSRLGYAVPVVPFPGLPEVCA